jgi:hypothetical protein
MIGPHVLSAGGAGGTLDELGTSIERARENPRLHFK